MSARFVVDCPACKARTEVNTHKPRVCPKCWAQLPEAQVASADDWGVAPPPAPAAPRPPQALPAPVPRPAPPPPLPMPDEDELPRLPRAAQPNSGSRLTLVLVGALLLAGGIGTAVVLSTRGEKPKDEPAVARSEPPPPPAPKVEPPRPSPKAPSGSPPAVTPAPKAPARPAPKTPDRPTPKEYVKLLTDAPPPAELSGEEVFKRLLPSSTLVLLSKTLGSGVLVDVEQKLMVTNAHVVKNEREVDVFFPAIDSEGFPKTEFKYYDDRARELAILGEVLVRNPTKDLALVRLSKVPPGVRPVSLALKPAAPGSKVFSIGNSGLNDGAMWRFTPGEVRGRSPQKYGDGLGEREYMVLETTAPSNPGDSGGPVVNARGELVALIAAGNNRARLVSLNVDLTEVRGLIEGYFRARGETWREPDPPAPPAPPAATFDNLVAVLKGGAPADRPIAARRLGELRGAAKAAVPALLGALDGADADLQTAAATALAQIGAPAAGAERALLAALRSPSADARAYAARALAVGPAAPDDAVPDLLAALADTSADVRTQVILALANMGAKARPGALGALLDRAGDSNPMVRTTATRAVLKLGAPSRDDRPVLLERLKGTDLRVRFVAFELLRALGVTLNEAREFWGPFLTHADPLPRRLAVESLGAPEFARAVVDDLLPLLSDADAEVRAAAARSVAQAGGAGRSVERLTEAFKGEKDESARAAMGEALAPLVSAEAIGVPALRMLLKDGSPVARERAAAKVETAGTQAAEAVPELMKCVEDAPTAVRVAALRALAAIGPRAPDAVPVAVRLFSRDKTPTAVLVAGVDVLAKCGGRAQLEVVCKKPNPVEVRARFCEAFQKGGVINEGTRVWLMDQAEMLSDSREAITKAVVTGATSETVKALVARTHVYKTVAAGEREQAYPNDYRKWVIRTLAEVNFKEITSERRSDVVKRLEYVAKNDKSNDLRGEAEAALALIK
jgi:S1-C subfamily serine protease/HEAT repeat protein